MGLFDIFKRKKPQSKPRPYVVRAYAGADGGRLFGSWTATDSSADEAVQYRLRTLRNRARQLAEDNEYIKRYLSLLKTNVVGPNGVILQVKAKDYRVDGTAKLDTKANAWLEEGYKRWCKKKWCSATRRHNMVTMQNLAISSIARDGEVFAVRVREKDKSNPYRLSVKMLEADYLDEMYDSELTNGNVIRMGIEQTPEGRPVAYHFFRVHPGDRKGMVTMNERVRVPAEDVLHLFLPERLSQTRGVPWFHASLRRTKMCAGYEEAELVAARAGASKMGFYVSPDGDAAEFGEDENGEFVEEMQPGTFGVVPKGYDIKEWDPKHPADAFDKFLKFNLRAIAASLNVAYPNLAADLEGTSYSSIRQGTLDERDVWTLLQNWLIAEFMEPVFEWWLEAALITQTIPLPLTKFDKFNAPVFRGRRWQWVDPEKDAKGDAVAMLNGFKTLTQVVTENGGDIEEHLAELAFEKEKLEELDIQLPYLSPKQPTQAQEEGNAGTENPKE